MAQAPPFFVWKDSFALGVEKVDVQHQRFFEIMNRLYAAMMCGSGQPQLKVLYDELQAYAALHFSEEEQFLRDLDYPALKEQQLQHEEFMRRLGSIQLDHAGAQSMLGFMKEWLLHHILGTDKSYSSWMATNGHRADLTQEPIAAGDQPIVRPTSATRPA